MYDYLLNTSVNKSRVTTIVAKLSEVYLIYGYLYSSPAIYQPASTPTTCLHIISIHLLNLNMEQSISWADLPLSMLHFILTEETKWVSINLSLINKLLRIA